LNIPRIFIVTKCVRIIYNQGTMGNVGEFLSVKVPGKKVVSSKEVVSY
jgi:hypothetical protein